MSRTTYVYRDGKVVDKATAAPLPSRSRSIHVLSDISEFVSPVDKSVISSRSTLRAHNKRHNVIQAGNDPSLYRQPKAYEPDMKSVESSVIDAFRKHGAL